MLTETCIFCGNSFRVPDELLGKKIKCPRCKELLGISAHSDAPAEVKADVDPSPTPNVRQISLARPSADEPTDVETDDLRFEGEELVLQTKPSVATLVVRVAAVAVVVVAAGGVFAALPLGLPTAYKIAAVVVFVLLGVGIAALISVEWANTVYLLTTSRVISRRGVLRYVMKSCALERIGAVVVKAGPVARILGVGTVQMSPGGWIGKVSWRGVDDAQGVANLVAQHVDHRHAFRVETEDALRGHAARAQ